MWTRLERTDYKKALKYLEDNSPFTCPIYGNVSSAGFAYKAMAMRSGIFYIYVEDGKILGIIAGFNDGNVMIHTKHDKADETALKIITGFPFHSVWGLSGSLPSSDNVRYAVGKDFDSRELDVMVQKQKIEKSFLPKLEAVRIDKRFLSKQYISFIKKCLWEGFGFKSNSWDIRKRIKERTQYEPYWIISDAGEFVAQAHVQAMTRMHGYIGGVCTPREQRRKGYAKEAVKRACDYIIAQKRIPALSVSAANRAAHTLYENLGFETVGTMKVYMQEREFKGDENS